MKIRGVIWDWLQKQADLCEAGSRDALLETCRQVGPIATMLDCGTTRIAAAVKAKRVLGIDVVPEQIAKAKARGIEGMVGNLDGGLNLPDASVDMIVASQVIEHVADTDKLVREFYRLLKPGGCLILGTPNLAALTNIIFLILGNQPTIVEVSDVALVGTWSPRKDSIDRIGPAHRRVFTRRAIKGLLQFYGYKCEKIIGFGFLPLPPLMGKLAASLLPVYSWNTIVQARKPVYHGVEPTLPANN
jgi:SAM-dependent methyltransferase